MAVLLGIFLAKLTSPIIALVGVISGMTGKAWWHFAVAACSAVAAQELLLQQLRPGRVPDPASLLLATVAAVCWIGIGYGVRRIRTRRAA